MQEHLFISYANEDWALAEWLALKLTGLGYKVWCDRFELLGGERFPRDIDKAIKEKTFRLLALLSKVSLEKENPTKERTLALNIGKERQVDFLIPLKVEPLAATDLNWMVSDITYVSFDESWATGLTQLVKNLEKIQTPRNVGSGNQVVASALSTDGLIAQKSERLYTNVIEIKRIPEIVKRFELRRPPSPPEADEMLAAWPAYYADQTTYLSFQNPPLSLADRLKIHQVGAALWRSLPTIDGISSGDIVSNLLRRSIVAKCLQRGLQFYNDVKILHYPNGSLKKNILWFQDFNGERTYVLAGGQRTKTGIKYRYYLTPFFLVRRDFGDEYSLLVRVRLFITNLEGKPLPRFSALARRKHVCARWWNKEWLNRQFAIIQYLAEGEDVISVGDGDEQVAFGSAFVGYSTDFGINEALLKKGRTEEELAYLEIERDDSENDKQDEVANE